MQSLGVLKAHVAGSFGCKADLFGVIIYLFKVSFLRGVSPRSTDLGDWLGSA